MHERERLSKLHKQLLYKFNLSDENLNYKFDKYDLVAITKNTSNTVIYDIKYDNYEKKYLSPKEFINCYDRIDITITVYADSKKEKSFADAGYADVLETFTVSAFPASIPYLSLLETDKFKIQETFRQLKEQYLFNFIKIVPSGLNKENNIKIINNKRSFKAFSVSECRNELYEIKYSLIRK